MMPSRQRGSRCTPIVVHACGPTRGACPVGGGIFVRAILPQTADGTARFFVQNWSLAGLLCFFPMVFAGFDTQAGASGGESRLD
jgi:hypothetical protein